MGYKKSNLTKVKWVAKKTACPKCGDIFVTTFKHIDYIEDEHGDIQKVSDIYNNMDEVYSECPACKKVILCRPLTNTDNVI